MTFYHLIRIMGRRWYVPVVSIISAVVLGSWFLRAAEAFTAQTRIVFTWSNSSYVAPENGSRDESVIAFAGAIAAEINNGLPAGMYARSDAPLYGAGIRQGVAVRVPNAGGQWVASFPAAVIEIQVVGPSDQWVQDQQRSLVDRIVQVSLKRQLDSGAASSDLIAARVDPFTLGVQPIGPSRAHAIMGLAALGIAAFLAGAAGSVLADRVLRRRNSRGRIVDGAAPQRHRSSTA